MWVHNIKLLIIAQSLPLVIGKLCCGILKWDIRIPKILKHTFPSIFPKNKISNLQCQVCELAIFHCASFPKSQYKPSKPFAIIHSDLWGPSRILNRTFIKRFVTFINDHTGTHWVYLLKEKIDVRDIFTNFYKMIKTQFQTQIQILRIDNTPQQPDWPHQQLFIKNVFLNGKLEKKYLWKFPQDLGKNERRTKSANLINHYIA